MNRKPILMCKVVIDGPASDVIRDVARLRPKPDTNSLVHLKIRAKAAEGSWMEDYELPVINSPNTIPARTVADGLYRQARITKEQYDELVKAIDALGPCANETGFMADRYNKKSMVD